MITDPYRSNVVLHIPFIGPNLGAAIVDYAPIPKVVSNVSVAIKTDHYKHYGSSGYFNGTSSYLSIPDHDELTFGANPFAIDAWIYPTVKPSLYSGSYYSVLTAKDGASGREFWLRLLGNSSGYTGIQLAITPNGTNFAASTGSYAIPLNTWTHIRAARDGNNLLVFANGSLLSTGSAGSYTISNTTTQLTIGKDNYNTGYFAGYICDLRVTNGNARSTSSFVPPDALISLAYPADNLPTISVGNNVTVSGNGAGDYVAIIDATTKELVTLVEPDTSGNWTASLPAGEYYALYFGDGCQPICHGPYTITVS